MCPFAELRALFQQFKDAVSTDKRILQQLTAWSEASRQWRSQWEGRGSRPSALTLEAPGFRPASTSQDGWVHPIGDEAPELNAWRALWDAATLEERNALAAAFVRAIARIESDPASAGDACGGGVAFGRPLRIAIRCSHHRADSLIRSVLLRLRTTGSRCSASTRAFRFQPKLVFIRHQHHRVSLAGGGRRRRAGNRVYRLSSGRSFRGVLQLDCAHHI